MGHALRSDGAGSLYVKADRAFQSSERDLRHLYWDVNVNCEQNT